MEAVLTNEVDDFSFCIRKGILPSKFQEWIKDKPMDIYTEILFQLVNEDLQSLFVIKIFKNERRKSNQFQV